MQLNEVLEEVSFLLNDKHKIFILFANIENGKSFSEKRAAVNVSLFLDLSTLLKKPIRASAFEGATS